MYIDIHTHKTDSEKDIISVQNINIPDYLCRCGLDLQSRFSLGIHPWKIIPERLPEYLNTIEQNSIYQSTFAIGECGLDKLSDTPWELQLRAFISQISISEKYNKPLIIHCVKAFDELLALKKEIKPKQAWIIHGFRGKPQMMKQLLAHNFYFSFGEKYNEETLKQTPLDRLFLETDDADVSIETIYKQACLTKELKESIIIDQLIKNFAEIV